ncbi:hypothetical protein ACTXT7_011051 [Hymenolepis weldensis]
MDEETLRSMGVRESDHITPMASSLSFTTGTTFEILQNMMSFAYPQIFSYQDIVGKADKSEFQSCKIDFLLSNLFSINLLNTLRLLHVSAASSALLSQKCDILFEGTKMFQKGMINFPTLSLIYLK